MSSDIFVFFNCVDFYDTTTLDFLKEKNVSIYDEWKKAQINM